MNRLKLYSTAIMGICYYFGGHWMARGFKSLFNCGWGIVLRLSYVSFSPLCSPLGRNRKDFTKMTGLQAKGKWRHCHSGTSKSRNCQALRRILSARHIVLRQFQLELSTWFICLIQRSNSNSSGVTLEVRQTVSRLGTQTHSIVFSEVE
ncbi:hypothetical protein RRG08_001090 [Elysia crispata]|uniref:Uncharacterized protein n=1 Tax=Elysia crispata TaxID=231223 RepID=A0AAE1AWG3_9GAST|nr:hypothetical protein RRG08_001090 [Elysia crispata]